MSVWPSAESAHLSHRWEEDAGRGRAAQMDAQGRGGGWAAHKQSAASHFGFYSLLIAYLLLRISRL